MRLSFSGPYLYWSVIHSILSILVSFGTVPISIGHSFIVLSVQFESRLHLYRLAIFLSVQFSSIWVFFFTTPITISHFSCQYEVEFLETTHISINHLFIVLSVQFELGSHLYWSVTFLSVQFNSSFFFWDHTYINKSFILSCMFCLSFGTTPISTGHSSCQFEFEF